MPGFIRVKNKHNGTEYTVSDQIALGDDVERINKPALDEHTGKPLPPKTKTSPQAPAPAGDSEPPTPAAKATTSKKE